jgi:hypothetical protein
MATTVVISDRGGVTRRRANPATGRGSTLARRLLRARTAMTTSRILFALALTAPLAAACTDPTVEDEFDRDDVVDVDDAKADIAGTYTYYVIERDLRRCAAPYCGGFWIDRVNSSTTRCHDGRHQERCYVASVDFGALGLGEAGLDRVQGAIDGFGLQKVLVRGTFDKREWPGVGMFGDFHPREAWLGQGPNIPDGPFAMVEDTGVRCVTWPCSFYREKKLNSSASALLAEIDWEASGAGEDAIARAIDDLFTNNVIIAGGRYTVRGPGGAGKARTATQFWLRATDEPIDEKTCYVGGCSGQICSENEGVISTCEWRDEYACYRDATCEVQADGACGWTETHELAACLADPTGA